jgi:hypothetical protein
MVGARKQLCSAISAAALVVAGACSQGVAPALAATPEGCGSAPPAAPAPVATHRVGWLERRITRITEEWRAVQERCVADQAAGSEAETSLAALQAEPAASGPEARSQRTAMRRAANELGRAQHRVRALTHQIGIFAARLALREGELERARLRVQLRAARRAAHGA